MLWVWTDWILDDLFSECFFNNDVIKGIKAYLYITLDVIIFSVIMIFTIRNNTKDIEARQLEKIFEKKSEIAKIFLVKKFNGQKTLLK